MQSLGKDEHPQHDDKPAFRELSADEAKQILARNHIGRVAFSFQDSIDIELLQYTYSDGMIRGRASRADLIRAAASKPWVAFEVDEARELFDWCSVVVKGTLELVGSATGSDADPTGRAEQSPPQASDGLVNAALPAPPLTYRDFRLNVVGITARGAHGSTLV
jgi:hypothetical protein